MKRFCIGDIHGQFKALKEIFKKSKFDYEKDLLIVLGDVVDGGPDTCKVIEELLKIKNMIFIVGNHDQWVMNHIKTGWVGHIWLSQGGKNTLKSYNNKLIPITHQDFLNRGVYYYELDNMMFVHGGFNPKMPKMSSQSKDDLLWDRHLINYAIRKIVPGYKKVFVGHTTTQTYGKLLEVKDSMAPIKFNNLIMMDCGAGWNGKLAIMNIDTEDYYTSKIQKPCI